MTTTTNPFEPIYQILDEIKTQQEEIIKAVDKTHENVPQINELMTVDDVCSLLRLSRSRIYSLRSEGQIPCLTNGLFERTAVIEWIKSKRKQPKTEVKGSAFNKFIK